ncbi:MAG: AAA family ATPase [Kouleothrix sp.]|nr:AAA family ATPase [Kouleothrix sp.]
MARVKQATSAQFYATAQRFVDAALRADDSLFTPGRPIWSPPVIADLYSRFVDHPDWAADTFETKFRRQLHGDALTPSQDAAPATYQLAGELLFVHLLPANGIGGATKRRIVNNILGWSPEPEAIPGDLEDVLDEGIARAGQFFLSGRNYQIQYLLEFVRHWKDLPESERERNLADPWAFKAFAFSVPISYAYAQREMLLHLAFPDTFEPIMSRDHKQQIATTFHGLVDPNITDVDQQLAQIRAVLTPQHGEGFSYYSESIKPQWQTGDEEAEEPNEDELRQIETSADESASSIDALVAWQHALVTDNPINRIVGEEYPRWLRVRFGERVKIAVVGAYHLRIIIDDKIAQALYFNVKYGPFVVLRDGWEWNLLPLQTGLRNPRSLKRRGSEGWRFFISAENDLQLLKQVTETTLLIAPPTPGMLPRTLGDQLRPYVQLVTHLTRDAYTAREIVDTLTSVAPAIVALAAPPNPTQLVDDLMRLRLLEPLDDGHYRRWAHLGDGSMTLLLRYAALTLLVRQGEEYMLPALAAPLDGLAYPPSSWPLGEPLLNWYAEAGLAQRNDDGTWQATPGALDPLDDERTTAQTINTFLANLRRARTSPSQLPALGDNALPTLPPELLKERIAEIQRELLIDHEIILRIYRSLVAGQHIILTGPPGTGKTHLAKLLPRVLWRDFTETVRITLPNDPSLPPTASPIEEPMRREGYLTEVVTATEDWGVRHVIGGIIPKLQRNGDDATLVYSIGYGCLTRAVLANYAGFDDGQLPQDDRPARREAADHEGNHYRGTWLVIDEFTRAQIDAAFGSLLTTLGGQRNPVLPIPTDDGERALRLPRDFRLIGTLNSFDRHFLNQISEAMKRRFAFIDVLPPERERAAEERAMAIFNALCRLSEYGVEGFSADRDLGRAAWAGTLSVRRMAVSGEGAALVRYEVEVSDDMAGLVLTSLWRVFEAARIYRQLGTAQAEATYAALFAGHAVGMTWPRALDAALADTLADQLQVLARDEQRVLLAFLEHSDNAEQFAVNVHKILEKMPGQRQMAHLSQFRQAERGDASIDDTELPKLTTSQLARIFDLTELLAIDGRGLFARRLRAFVNERGL